MNDNEYKYAKCVAIKNCIVVMSTATVVLALFKMSGSWHSLWGLLLCAALSTVKSEDEQ